jgi:hypothetical protein
MRHLSIVIHVDLVAVILGQPLAGEAEARVDANALVRHMHSVFRRLVGDLNALLDESVNASRARLTEPSGEFGISFPPFVDRRSRRHLRILANLRQRLTFG